MAKPKDNCLNIGRDEITPALFAHMPRAPEVCADFPDQRRFGGYCAVFQNFGTSTGTGLSMTVYRHSTQEHGELQVSISNLWNDINKTTVDMTADEMQTLACALIDAAHDLRTRPAVKAKKEAVAA